MKKTDLLPTHGNLLDTYNIDAIGRNSELFYFVKLLNSITGSYSIALDGRWGSGKTFFVKQTQMIFDAHNEFTQIGHDITEEERCKIKETWAKICRNNHEETWEPTPAVCVYFDAWEYDNDDNPLASLIYQISETASKAYKFEGERNYLDIAVNIIDLISGKNYRDLINSLKKTSITQDVKVEMTLRETINNYLNELLPEHGERLLVFIDELDRCNPCYAVNLLEKIKHYFANENITFVFSVNLEQLQYTIQQHYGSGFNAHKYLDRFVDLTIPMPRVNWSKYNESIGLYSSTLLYQVAEEIVRKHQMEMREASRYYTALKIMSEKRTHSNQNTADKEFCYYFVIPIALGLYKHDLSRYHDFIEGKDFSPLGEIASIEDFQDAIGTLLLSSREEKTGTTVSKKVEEAYNALFIGAKKKESRSFGSTHIRESTLNYFFNTISMLNDAATLD